MGLPDTEDTGARPRSADNDGEERGAAGGIAARCWALLLARIYKCLPPRCPRCGEPMRILATVFAPVCPPLELKLDDRGGLIPRVEHDQRRREAELCG